MAEYARFFTSDPLGASGPDAVELTEEDWLNIWHGELASLDPDAGPHPNVLDELEVTVVPGGVEVGAGMARCRGFWYYNTTPKFLAITTPPAGTGTTGYRVVVKAEWGSEPRVTAQTVPSPSGDPDYEPLVQDLGTRWDMPLARVSITDAGTVALTFDDRAFLHYATRVSEEMYDDASLPRRALGPDVVDDASIENSTSGLRVKALGILTGMLAALAVTTAKIADLAVTTAKIALGAVGTNQLANGAATTAKLADNAADYTKLGTGALQMPGRQGGASTVWKTPGTGVQTTNEVLRQVGVVDVAIGVGDKSAYVDVTYSGYNPVIPVLSASVVDCPVGAAVELARAAVEASTVNSNTGRIWVTRSDPSNTAASQTVTIKWEVEGDRP